MALFDVLADVFTAGVFSATKVTAGLRQRDDSGETGDASRSDLYRAGLPPFQLQDGFLLETDTGRIWRFDEEIDAFVELRLLSSPAREKVSPDILASLIQKTEDEIERALRDIPDQQKQAVRSVLEENYKKVLVWGLVQSRALTAEMSAMAAR